MIRTGEISDIDAILNITKSCALHMIQNNIRQWNEHYPDRGSFINCLSFNSLSKYFSIPEIPKLS